MLVGLLAIVMGFCGGKNFELGRGSDPPKKRGTGLASFRIESRQGRPKHDQKKMVRRQEKKETKESFEFCKFTFKFQYYKPFHHLDLFISSKMSHT